MVVLAFGQLGVKVASSGVLPAIKRVDRLHRSMAEMHKKIRPRFEQFTKTMNKFGILTAAAMWKLIQASPRLAAAFEILNLRTNQFLRQFGDELAPVITFVANLVKGLTEWFASLPEPMQKAIKFGFKVVAVLGLLAIAFIAVQAAASPVLLVILGIGVAAAALFYIWETNLFGIQDITKTVFEAIGVVFDGFMTLINLAIDTTKSLQGISETVFNAIFTVIIENIGGILDIFDLWVSGFEAIVAPFQGVIDSIKSVFTDLVDFLFTDPVTRIQDFIDTILGIFGLGGGARAGGSGLMTIVDFLETFPAYFTGAFDAVINAFTGLGESVTAAISTIVDSISGFGELAAAAIESIITAFDPILSFLTDTLIPAFSGSFLRVLTDLNNFGSMLVTTTVNIVTMFCDIFSNITSCVEDSLNSAIDIWNVGMEALSGDAETGGNDIIGVFGDALSGGLEAGGEASEELWNAADDLGTAIFGGSLPKETALSRVDESGRFIGKTWVENIAKGIREGGETRIFNIQSIEMITPEASLETARTFMAHLDTKVRKATRF